MLQCSKSFPELCESKTPQNQGSRTLTVKMSAHTSLAKTHNNEAQKNMIVVRMWFLGLCSKQRHPCSLHYTAHDRVEMLEPFTFFLAFFLTHTDYLFPRKWRKQISWYSCFFTLCRDEKKKMQWARLAPLKWFLTVRYLILKIWTKQRGVILTSISWRRTKQNREFCPSYLKRSFVLSGLPELFLTSPLCFTVIAHRHICWTGDI